MKLLLILNQIKDIKYIFSIIKMLINPFKRCKFIYNNNEIKFITNYELAFRMIKKKITNINIIYKL